MKKISIAKIRVNGGTQSRAEINRKTVAEYAEAMEGGAEFPPLVVFYDGSTYWLADGFHRYEAASRARQYEVMADIRQGSQRDAILHSVGANASHGLRRTNDDKRRAVMVLLNDPEWSKWSNREIARQCGVSERLVRDVRPICDKNADSAPRTVTRNGTTYEQNTANIGASKPDQETPSDTQAALEGQPAPSQADAPQGSDGAGEPEHEWPVPPPDPYGYAKLTEEALLDTANGLRADLEEEKARRKRAEAEARDAKAKLKDFEGDQAESIRQLQKKADNAGNAKWKALEDRDAWSRKAHALEKENAKLRKELEHMEVPLN